VLRNLPTGRGVGWDPKLSDGAGCLIQIPDRFFARGDGKQTGGEASVAGQ